MPSSPWFDFIIFICLVFDLLQVFECLGCVRFLEFGVVSNGLTFWQASVSASVAPDASLRKAGLKVKLDGRRY